MIFIVMFVNLQNIGEFNSQLVIKEVYIFLHLFIVTFGNFPRS